VPEPSPNSSPPSPTDPGFGVYVHWPFCQSKCPYCDFNSHVRESVEHDRWARALVAELDAMASLAPGREVTSVFFGGGTPSLMEPKTVAALLDRIAALMPVAQDVEITLEANPGSVEADRFAGYRSAGVNRLSLGVQALDDDALRQLGRRHDLAEALRALDIARRLFDRVSFDLIYARPGQTLAVWRAELARALALGTEHLSLYQLTLEQGTRFWTLHQRGELQVPGEDAAADLFDLTQAMTAEAGLPAYEISNHARPGAESRHNLTYWRSGEWIGIGPGAHGRLTQAGRTVARRQAKVPETWLAAVEAAGHGTAETESVARRERVEEVLMMGLRLTEGVGDETMRRAAGLGLADALPPERTAPLVASGHLVVDRRGVRLTPTGRPVLNAVLARLLA
jgi:oxygen-independent coproporphyrinogen-3 oxidase